MRTDPVSSLSSPEIRRKVVVLPAPVGPSSTIRVNHKVYSVDSRLIGERIHTRLFMDRIEIWYGQKKVDTLPRLIGEKKHKINYRHIIDSLIRKPGAFENYRYWDDLFPTSRFRIAYDALKKTTCPIGSHKAIPEHLIPGGQRK
jgi:hypothetical protein